MLVQVPDLVQVDFLLQDRKADLALISMKELDTLMSAMVLVQNHIIKKGFLVKKRVTIGGVMTSTNA